MKKYILPLLSIALFSMTSCNEDAKVQTETTAADINNPIDITSEALNNAQEMSPEVVSNPTTIKMDKMEHDFGAIDQDKPAFTTFTITNTGTNPLIISSAKGSCGCTVPTFPKEPIAPGESGTIEVSFDPSGKPGPNNKTVTILANTEPANTVLNVKATVN